MGYKQWTADDQQFFIAAAAVPAAAFAMRDEFDQHYPTLEAYLADYERTALEMLERQIEDYGWHFVTDPAGNITAIRDQGELNGGYLADEHLQVLSGLVPFVPTGSFIEIRDEDGARWRYVFDGQAVRKVDGRVSFDG